MMALVKMDVKREVKTTIIGHPYMLLLLSVWHYCGGLGVVWWHVSIHASMPPSLEQAAFPISMVTHSHWLVGAQGSHSNSDDKKSTESKGRKAPAKPMKIIEEDDEDPFKGGSSDKVSTRRLRVSI